MTLTPAKKSKNFDPVPAGNHVARLYQIIHIGTIPTQWQGTEKMTDKIRLTFELCDEKKEFKEGEGAKPFSISREFTYSWGAKGNLRPFIEGFIGTKLHDDEAYNFNLEDLLGEACLLNVVHTEKDGNTYSNIQGASPLPKESSRVIEPAAPHRHQLYAMGDNQCTAGVYLKEDVLQ